MRQLIVQVPQGHGKDVLNIAKDHQGVNLVQIEANSLDHALDLVIVYISNRRVEDFLRQLESLPDVHITLLPSGVMALHPPSNQAAEQVTNVEPRSPVEVFLSGLQSVGSWKGFLGYAALGGVVAWIGLFTNTIYLLTAAMLIAPFAGPAMTAAIATARGDRKLLGRSLARYFSALSLTIAIAALLSLLFGQSIATSQMIERSQVSVTAILLPLAAGAAGALNLVQSERSSLVSGAATGMLVAASLAPPAGVVGMAVAIGRWDLATGSLFLLLLQLCGINLSAALLFRRFGLSTRGARYTRGKKLVFPIALLITALALIGLLVWQLANSPNLQRASLSQRANAEVHQVIGQEPSAQLVEANVRFTRSSISGQNTLLTVLYVQRSPDATESDAIIRDRLTKAIQARLTEQYKNITPLVSVNVLAPPNQN
ncbi:TIGR00341 family protein [Leptolyngbya sp. FACHB-711]|uniref:TIGR00341 family protein n=1 Tax=unclassified Leptolyngbya TaxID=2650499 RepID=UPI001685A099|nr:TIGR00341 family protein [Leptolyngbya sp. FACHB-711]MBD2024478.1 TIGR00341 family protein [Leptolyngbya sp. FACHB-711]